MTEIAANRVFVDTNILVYSSLDSFPLYEQANRRLSQLLLQHNEIWISRQVLREYLVTMTRPAVVRASITLEEVLNIANIFIASYQVADETKEVTNKLMDLLQQVSVEGGDIYDANIVATMQTYKIGRLLTHNVADFLKYTPGITVLPLFEGQS